MKISYSSLQLKITNFLDATQIKMIELLTHWKEKVQYLMGITAPVQIRLKNATRRHSHLVTRCLQFKMMATVLVLPQPRKHTESMANLLVVSMVRVDRWLILFTKLMKVCTFNLTLNIDITHMCIITMEYYMHL